MSKLKVKDCSMPHKAENVNYKYKYYIFDDNIISKIKGLRLWGLYSIMERKIVYHSSNYSSLNRYLSSLRRLSPILRSDYIKVRFDAVVL